MEGKRNRGEVTAELSEKVWARLRRKSSCETGAGFPV